MFPLTVAEAITVHKAQGATMAIVVVHIPKNIQKTALYVALSRASSLKGLYIVGTFNPTKPDPPTHRVVVEMARLRKEPLIPRFSMLKHVPKDVYQIISYNIQSAIAHTKHIIGDSTFINSDLILLQELWINNKDKIEIPGFVEVIRTNNDSNQRIANGSGIYVNQENQENVSNKFEFVFKNVQERIFITVTKFLSISVVNIYKNPHASLKSFKEIYKKKK